MEKQRALLLSIATVVLALCFFVSANGVGAKAFKFRVFYGRGVQVSDLARQSEGKVVEVEGFMAPPLKAQAKFFVLTKLPMSFCPFCEKEAEWPDNIMVVYTKEIIEAIPYNYPIVVTGKLEIGAYQDPENNFWSKLRIVDATFEKL